MGRQEVQKVRMNRYDYIVAGAGAAGRFAHGAIRGNANHIGGTDLGDTHGGGLGGG